MIESRQATPPDPALVVGSCSECGEVHWTRRTLTAPLLAVVTGYSITTIYTLKSRGGTLPKPVVFGAIGQARPQAPRWSSCDISAWMHGTLPPEKLQPVRSTPARVVIRKRRTR